MNLLPWDKFGVFGAAIVLLVCTLRGPQLTTQAIAATEDLHALQLLVAVSTRQVSANGSLTQVSEQMTRSGQFIVAIVSSNCQKAETVLRGKAGLGRSTEQYLLGRCWHATGQTSKAVAVWRDTPGADLRFMNIAQLCDDTSEPSRCGADYYQLAALTLSHADWDDVWLLLTNLRAADQLHYRNALLSNLEDLPETSPHLIGYVKARIHADQGRYQLALRYYREIITSEPPYVRVYVDAGKAALRAGEYELARSFLGEGIRVDNRQVMLYRLMAATFQREGDLQLAYDWYEMVPDDFTSLLNRGLIRYEQDRYNESIALLKLALGKRETADLNFLLARSMLGAKEYSEARLFAERAIRMNSASPSYFGLLGQICGRLGDDQCASEALRWASGT